MGVRNLGHGQPAGTSVLSRSAASAHHAMERFTSVASREEFVKNHLRVPFVNRHQLFFACTPPALLSVCLSLALVLVRIYYPGYMADFQMKSSFAASVIGTLTGFLLVMRITDSFKRWSEGMMHLCEMEQHLKASFFQVMAHLEFAHKASKGQENLHLRRIFVHWYSLLLTVGIKGLYFASGCAYGTLHADHMNLYRKWEVMDIYLDWTKQGQARMSNPLVKYQWPRRLLVLGSVTEAEAALLSSHGSQVEVVSSWILRLLFYVLEMNVVTVPPPVFARAIHEFSLGIENMVRCYQIAVVPIPTPLKAIAHFLIWVQLIFGPFMIEMFSLSGPATVLLSMINAYGYMMLYFVAEALENPFGDDVVDLPMAEIHESYTQALLMAASTHSYEVEGIAPFACPVADAIAVHQGRMAQPEGLRLTVTGQAQTWARADDAPTGYPSHPFAVDEKP